MDVQLRVVLDQLRQVADPDQAGAATALTRGLVRTAPRGCAVSAIVPHGVVPQIDGLHDIRTLSLGRRELLSAWQLGFARGAGGGLIHAPSLAAPLVRHDRVHNNDQTTVTLWDLHAWQQPERLLKPQVAWHRAMLKRAFKHADAVVVPSHAMAEQLGEIAPFGSRIRVIAGAAPIGFAVPDDADVRRTRLRLPRRYVVVTGEADTLADGFRAATHNDIDAVVLDAPEGSEPHYVDAAAAAGLPEGRAHVRTRLDEADRAAALGGAEAVIATDPAMVWPWRVVEAMQLGVPVVAVSTGVHHDVIADGGAVVDVAQLSDAVEDALGAGAARLRVLASDRSRAFSWLSAAERVWALHAEL